MREKGRYVEGTSHAEYLHLDEGDTRRHKSKCSYYEAKTGYCRKHVLMCSGSAHCEYYCEEVRQKPFILTEEQKRAIEAADARRLKKYLDKIRQHKIMQHITKGNCRIISVTDSTILVSFLADGKQLELGAKFCMEHNLLENI